MKFPTRIPFVETLGLQLLALEHGRAEIELDLRPEQLNAFEVAHGGVLMSLLDVAMAHAARSLNVPSAQATPPGAVTVEMKTSFMRPAQGRLRAEGRVVHRTATLVFCEGAVFNASGEACAQATGTFMIVRALASSHDRVRPLRADASEVEED